MFSANETRRPFHVEAEEPALRRAVESQVAPATTYPADARAGVPVIQTLEIRPLGAADL